MAAAKKSPKDLLGSLGPNAVLVMIWVLGVIVVLAGYLFGFYQPLDEERTAAQSRKTALQTQRRTEEENLRRYNTDQAELERARRRAESLQSVLPNDPDIPGFMRSVNNLAEAAGLQIRLIQPVAERAEQYYARIPVQLTLHGTFLSLARFFYQVAQLPRVINMENIKLATPTQDPTTREVRVVATVMATTFRGVARPAAPATPAPGARR
jgi:type IV pilus assembly protein PilO